MYHSEIQIKTRYCGGTGIHDGLKIHWEKSLRVQISSVAPIYLICFTPFIIAKRKDAWRFGQTNTKNTLLYIGDWRNGSAADFDSVGGSSTLSSPAKC